MPAIYIKDKRQTYDFPQITSISSSYRTLPTLFDCHATVLEFGFRIYRWYGCDSLSRSSGVYLFTDTQPGAMLVETTHDSQ